jgi:transposase InsO family protein
VWSYDFDEDRTEKNRKLRMLVVIDEFTRESLAIEVAWSFRSQQVIEVLQFLFAVRGAPEHLRSDNGPEFVARAVTRWLHRAGVKTWFIAKGSPWENGYVESFNSRFRDELLDRELFIGLEEGHVGLSTAGGSITPTTGPTARWATRPQRLSPPAAVLPFELRSHSRTAAAH